MSRWENRIPPLAVLALMALAMWSIAVWTPRLAVEIPAYLVVASACGAAGVAIVVAGVLSFIKARTTVDPVDLTKVSSFVQAGMFTITRNPMYLGMAVALLGWAVFLRHPLALVGVALFVAFITRLQIIPEERMLATRFGPDYDAYLRRVRRWI